MPRAERSTDVTVMNDTDLQFTRTGESIETGIWSTGMIPPENIPAKGFVTYGCESDGFATGCTAARVVYTAKSIGASFWIQTSNPFVGDNWAAVDGGEHFNISYNVGSGNNNMVTFMIKRK